MHTFLYALHDRTLSGEILAKVTALAECKGKQTSYLRAKPEALRVLRETTIRQSTVASNAVEGIEVSPRRLASILGRADHPRGRPEEEIAGYRDLLRKIDNLDDPHLMAVSPDMILGMHRDLYKYTISRTAGYWKSRDNVIETRIDGGAPLGVAFRPPAAALMPQFMLELCNQLRLARSSHVAPDVVIIAAFALDFLCIHPFDDGNGRMVRLLTHLLLLQDGYLVGKYVPLERLIFETKNAYYAALRESSAGWHDRTHNPDSWNRYLLDVLLRAYRELEQRVDGVLDAADPKAALIRDAILSRQEVSTAGLRAIFPDVSRAHIFRVVKALEGEGRLRRTTRGRYAVPYVTG